MQAPTSAPLAPQNRVPTSRARIRAVLRGLGTPSVIVFIHSTVFLLPFVEVSGWAIATSVTTAIVVGLGLTVGYHRYFSHRAFKTSRALQFVLAIGGCLSLQRGPLWWAATHRLHHRHSDRVDDPHSPVHTGFWHSHLGWLFSRDILDLNYATVKDFVKFPELVWLDRLWMAPGLLFALGCYLLFGWGGALGYCAALAVVFQVTFCLTSVCHMFGSRRFETGEASRNNWVVALLTNGEGWHNNHHAAPYSARHGFRWYELDSSYALISMFARLGLVWDVKLPPPDVLAGTKLPGAAGSGPSTCPVDSLRAGSEVENVPHSSRSTGP